MSSLDLTIARALDGFPAGTELSFDSLRDAATAAQRVERNGRWYDLTRPTEHAPGTHRLIRHYVRTTVPVPGVAVTS